MGAPCFFRVRVFWALAGGSRKVRRRNGSSFHLLACAPHHTRHGCWRVCARAQPLSIGHVWSNLRVTREAWLSTADAYDDLPWADRAAAIAALCLPGKRWGNVAQLHAALPPAEAPDIDECSVCYDQFEDTLPRPGGCVPAATGMFACSHVLCRTCDRAVQQLQNPRCPLCRQPRVRWLP